MNQAIVFMLFFCPFHSNPTDLEKQSSIFFSFWVRLGKKPELLKIDSIYSLMIFTYITSLFYFTTI